MVYTIVQNYGTGTEYPGLNTGTSRVDHEGVTGCMVPYGVLVLLVPSLPKQD